MNFLKILHLNLVIERTLDLCDIWETIDRTNRWGFVSNYINKLGNSEAGMDLQIKLNLDISLN